VQQFANEVERMSIGLPWDSSQEGDYPQITPLPNQGRLKYMIKLIDDAILKGASIMNSNGGSVIGGSDSTLMIPAVLYPVTNSMDLYHQEQFGPVIPIVPYDTIEEVLEYGREGAYGQQVSIFTSDSQTITAARLLDMFSAIFGKINLNSQCGRSPDTLPFSGRRSSAMGVMSARYAVKEFSIPTVIAHKDQPSVTKIMSAIEKSSKFMEII
jgi:glyceraldehyde-3-phosphate dehydrogenase (NADP+)